MTDFPEDAAGAIRRAKAIVESALGYFSYTLEVLSVRKTDATTWEVHVSARPLAVLQSLHQGERPKEFNVMLRESGAEEMIPVYLNEGGQNA